MRCAYTAPKGFARAWEVLDTKKRGEKQPLRVRRRRGLDLRRFKGGRRTPRFRLPTKERSRGETFPTYNGKSVGQKSFVIEVEKRYWGRRGGAVGKAGGRKSR